jgi:FtsH-binding integral membrane protein
LALVRPTGPDSLRDVWKQGGTALSKEKLVMAFVFPPIIGIPFCLPAVAFNPMFLLLPHTVMLFFGIPFIRISQKRGLNSLGHYLAAGIWASIIISVAFAAYFLLTGSGGVAILAVIFAFLISIIPCLLTANFSWRIVVKSTENKATSH